MIGQAGADGAPDAPWKDMSEIHSGDSLTLAAAPTFATMALTTGFIGGDPGNML